MIRIVLAPFSFLQSIYIYIYIFFLYIYIYIFFFSGEPVLILAFIFCFEIWQVIMLVLETMGFFIPLAWWEMLIIAENYCVEIYKEMG